MKVLLHNGQLMGLSEKESWEATTFPKKLEPSGKSQEPKNSTEKQEMMQEASRRDGRDILILANGGSICSKVVFPFFLLPQEKSSAGLLLYLL